MWSVKDGRLTHSGPRQVIATHLASAEPVHVVEHSLTCNTSSKTSPDITPDRQIGSGTRGKDKGDEHHWLPNLIQAQSLDGFASVALAADGAEKKNQVVCCNIRTTTSPEGHGYPKGVELPNDRMAGRGEASIHRQVAASSGRLDRRIWESDNWTHQRVH